MRQLHLMGRDEAGFWESRGYHNYGDPRRGSGTTVTGEVFSVHLAPREVDKLLIFAAGELARKRRALDRLRAGEYGSCLTCGDPIAPARLRAMPEVPTCVAYQEEAEMACARGR